VRWLFVGSGYPDVGVTVPAVIAVVPGPIAMLRRRRWDDLMRTCRRSDTDDYLGLGNARGEEQSAGYSREEFLHRTVSFVVLKVGRGFQQSSCYGDRRF
jgi:hypothetical protein